MCTYLLQAEDTDCTHILWEDIAHAWWHLRHNATGVMQQPKRIAKQPTCSRCNTRIMEKGQRSICR
jgi:hypothetical protein